MNETCENSALAPSDGPVVLAVCGKGGVGKTSVCAAVVRWMLEEGGRRVLAIDADPAMGLAGALGLSVRKTVDDLRLRLIRELGDGAAMDREALLHGLDYGIFEAVVERGPLACLAIGRPESEGCYCKVNALLREVIGPLLKSFDLVIIDGEAGIEQVNRRVLEAVSHLLLVSDGSARGLTVATAILGVARQAVRFRKAGLLLNRALRDSEARPCPALFEATPLGPVPEDLSLRRLDERGGSIFEPEAEPFTRAVQARLKPWLES